MEVGNPSIRLRTITRLMGRHFTQSLRDGGANPERVLRLFTDRVVADLKALPTEDPAPAPAPTLYHTRVPMKSDD